METNESNNPLTKTVAILTIIGMVVASIFWVANVSATASHADSLSQQNSAEIQKKAGKEELNEMKQDIKDIRNFLLNGKKK